MQDWKDLLGATFGITPDSPEQQALETNAAPPRGDALTLQGRRPVHIVYERKGRGGKQATILTDFVADDNTLRELATTLKHTLGVGGSTRGGEILLQGDVRERVRDLLAGMGFNVR